MLAGGGSLTGPGVAQGLAVAGAPDLEAVVPLDRAAPEGGAVLIVHYHRADRDYARWNLWTWRDGHDGQPVAFDGEDAFGRFAVLDMSDRPERVNFIVRQGEWENKDIGHDRAVAVDDRGIAEVWLVSGDPAVYTDPATLDFQLKLRAGFLDEPDRVRVTFSHAVRPRELSRRDLALRHAGEAIEIQRVAPVEMAGGVSRTFDLQLARPLALDQLHQPLTLTLPGGSEARVEPRDVLDDPALRPGDAELGPDYASAATTFRTWAPTAEAVDVLLYASATADSPRHTAPLSRTERGLWETTLAGDLHGTYYQLRFTHHQQATAVPDIHAYAASADSLRSMVIDLDRTDPEGFRDHAPPTLASMVDEIIYEVHVRDFSVADKSVPAASRGKYPGLVHGSPDDASGVTTSLAHLKDLGVTAVHLLPIHDFSNARSDYNWGYWTTLFNVPESDYSTTPDDPAATIRELKQTIQTLHEHDLRVILDVVYNHTSITAHPSPFETTAPRYYFRTTDDGSMRNDAGTGNSIADERAMVRRYIVDSLIYWATEYKVDGFRFDLLGTHHPETVAEITRELRRVRPDLTLYGEPWTGGGPTYFPPGAQRGLGMAVFNDRLRNAVRGDLDGDATGFATGPGGDLDAVRRNLAGALDEFADAPTESVGYVSAHDNRTFWDKLLHTHPHADDATKRAMHKLAHGIVLTSQGIAFLHGGADFARTKGGNHNSYNAGDAVNQFDWARKAEFAEVHDYFRGLIQLRRSHPAFRLRTADQVRANLRFFDTPAGVIGYQLDGAAVNDPWPHIAVIYNGEPHALDVPLPRGQWNTVVNHHAAGTRTLDQVRRSVELPPYSMWVGHRP